MGYGDYHIGNVMILSVYYVEGLRHNLFFVRKFCDLNFEVAFHQHTCINCKLEGDDLLTESGGNNLYTLSFGDMMASSPICLLSKALKTKSWLWHRHLSHLNVGIINHLPRHSLVRGLPKLKFEKDHLCFACAMAKSKKKPHKPKSKDTNQEKLYLLHMDLYGPMRVASVNGKKCILVIVDDYSRFTWVKCLRSKEQIMKLSLLIKLCVNAMRWLASLMKHLLLSLYRKMVSLKDVIARTIPPPSIDPLAPEVIAPIAKVVAPEPVESTGSPSLTIVDQDAPSSSNSQTTPKTQSPVIFNDDEEVNHDLDVAHMNNDPFFGILILENDYESSSLDVIPTIMHTAAPNSEHITK
nr:retrovirus-related Pol polyprotein from transposon TNT 1-94 [Tanacetum cinerariifolium]